MTGEQKYTVGKHFL